MNLIQSITVEKWPLRPKKFCRWNDWISRHQVWHHQKRAVISGIRRKQSRCRSRWANGRALIIKRNHKPWEATIASARQAASSLSMRSTLSFQPKNSQLKTQTYNTSRKKWRIAAITYTLRTQIRVCWRRCRVRPFAHNSTTPWQSL